MKITPIHFQAGIIVLGIILSGGTYGIPLLMAEEGRTKGAVVDNPLVPRNTVSLPGKTPTSPSSTTKTGISATSATQASSSSANSTTQSATSPKPLAVPVGQSSPEALRIDRKITEYLKSGNLEKALLAINYGEKILNREKSKEIRLFLWNRLQTRKKQLASQLSRLLEKENERLEKRIAAVKQDSKNMARYEQMNTSVEFVRKRVKSLREVAGSLPANEREKVKNLMDRSIRHIKAAEKLSPPFGGTIADYPSYAYISSPFGYRIHPIRGYQIFHSGIDIPFDYGHPLKSLGDGIVTFSGYDGGYGNMVEVTYDHPTMGKISVLYAHLDSREVEPGATVKKGQIIGKAGSTGLSTGPHLHMEVLKNGVAIDPTTVSGIKFP